MNEMNSAFGMPFIQRAAQFTRNQSGNFTMLFAITAPVMLIGISAAVSMSDNVTFKQELQAAADSAALVATTAMVNGKSASDAQTIAQNFFATNAPGYAQDGGSLNVYTGALNSTVNATVSYQVTFNSLMNSMFGGGGTSLLVKATSQASTLSPGGGGSISYTGTGSIWGDPHLDGADGTGGVFSGCATTPPTWYNALSDSGIEVNISCYYDPYWQQEGIQSFSLIIGAHTFYVTTVLPDVIVNSDGSMKSIDYHTGSFTGGITIDNVYYPPVLGSTTYLGGLVTVSVDNPDDPSDESNYIKFKYVNGATKYDITLNYQIWQLGSLNVTATNAGLCGVPGGIFGQTLGGVNDMTPADFQVPTATSTTFQFNWSNCAPQAAISSTSHLTQ